MDVLAPVIEEPCLAKSFGRNELLFEVLPEAGKDIGIIGIVAGSLVIYLPADHVGIVFVMRNDMADEPLGVKTIGRRVGVHILAHAVSVLER